LWRKIGALARRPALRGLVGGTVMALSFGYLGYILVRNWGELVAYDWRVDYRQVALAFICYSAALMFAVLGWSLIMGRLTQATSLRRHMKYYIYTNLFRRLPAPLLYLFGRVYLYEQEGVTKSVTVTISLLEWVLIVLSGIIVYLLTLPFLSLPPAWRSPWLPLGMLVGYGNVLVWLIIYILVWIGGGLVLYAVINSIYALPLARLPTVVGIWVLSGLITTLVFATSAGLGLKDVTLGVLLGYLMPSPLAVIVALLMRVCPILFATIWGIVALRL
jgi:hypothetical protein